MTEPAEQSANPIHPSFAEIASAYQEVLDYNQQHTGFGAIFGGIVKSMAEHTEPLDETEIAADQDMDLHKAMNETIGQQVVEGDMQGELQDIFHGDTFMQAGIRLQRGSYVSSGLGDRASSESRVPFVDNTTLFAEFLSGIELADMNNKIGVSLLISVASNLRRVITFGVGADKEAELTNDEKQIAKEASEDALRTWSLIQPEYERLGLSAQNLRKQVKDSSSELKAYLNDDERSSVVPTALSEEYRRHRDAQHRLNVIAPLEEYISYWGQGLLPEYIHATDKGYITPGDEDYGFGPRHWAEDMSAEELTKRWETAMDFIEAVKSKADGELVGKLRDSLKSALEFSISRMQHGESRAIGGYDRAVQVWKEHDEKPYAVDHGNSTTHVYRAPEKETFDYRVAYFRNNRLALEAALLRFQQL